MAEHGRTRWLPAGGRVPGLTWPGAAWLLLPIAAWAVGVLWLGGDLGRSTDDYSVNFRDPATGELPSPFNPWASYPFFWRPLHNAMCFGLGTLFAEHWRVLIVFCAVMHGLACLAVYALLRTGTRSRGPAAAGALALLLHPMNFEVALWFCSISTAIATAMWCLLALWCGRIVRRPCGPDVPELLGVAAVALAIPCFYEQPASGALALPFVLLAIWLPSPGGPRLAPAFGRAVLLSGIAGAMNIVYIVLLRLTAPATFRGGSDSFAAPDRLPDRLAEVARSIHWQLLGRRLEHTTKGAWETGTDALATPTGIAAIGVLAVLAIVWAWAWWSEQPPEQPSEQPYGLPDKPRSEAPARQRAIIAAARANWIIAGGVLFAAAFIPIVLMHRQNVEPRTLYFPLVGLCMILAQALDALLCALPRTGIATVFSRAARASVALAVGAAVIAGCICSVGIQSWHHQRAKRDEAIAQRLAELIPDPPPHAVYIPLALDDSITATGYPLFDRLRPAAFGTTWSATSLMRQKTRRADVIAAAINPWAKYPFDRFSAGGLWFAFKLDGRASDPASEGDFITWDRAIPFTVDADGRVRLVRQIEIVRSDDRIEAFGVPVVRAAIRAGTARGYGTAITLTDSADPAPSLVSEWRWVDPATGDTAGEIAMLPLDSRGTKREGVWLHPTYQGATRAAIQATIEPSRDARTLRFRITTPPGDYVRFAGAAPVTVKFEVFAGGTIGTDSPAPLAAASIVLSPELAESEPRWAPIEVLVPGSDAPLALRVRVAGGPKGPFAPVWVTPGMWIDAAR